MISSRTYVGSELARRRSRGAPAAAAPVVEAELPEAEPSVAEE